MCVKEMWLGHCQELHRIYNDQAVPYGDEVSDRLSKLSESIRDYEFKVYLVGPFSCGKSTLLNTWLGVDLLPKGIAPETAVATELHYSASEKTVAYPFGDGDGLGNPVEIPGVGREQMRKVAEMANDGKLALVCLYIDNAKLKENSDVCLVDLPGLSSACKAHELALDQFVLEKSIGILCVPMPAGTVQQDALEFLQDMERYRASFNLLLTKSDECIDSDRDAIVRHVADTVRNRLGIPESEMTVGVVSKDDVAAFTQQLEGLRGQKEKLFEERFRGELLAVCIDMLSPLKLALSEEFTTEKLDGSISGLEEAEGRLNDIFNEVSARIAEAVPMAVDRVVENVKSSLADKSEGWLNAMKMGSNISSDIQATIKRIVMYHANSEMHDICDEAARKASREFGKCVAFSMGDIGAMNVEALNAKFTSAEEIVKSAVVGFAAGAASYSLAVGTVGAAIGSVVPILGTGIGFVVGSVIGGLIGAFSNSSSKIAENNRVRDELLEKLDMEAEKARQPIQDMLNNAIEQFKANLKTAMENKIASLKEQMESIKAERAKSREEFEAKKTVRLAAVEKLECISAKVGEQ